MPLLPAVDLLPFDAPDSLEERANALSHAVGGAVAIAAMPLLTSLADLEAHPLRWSGMMVFLSTMVLAYLASALFHAAPAGPVRRLLRRCDHATIFLFIAGSFTPFVLEAAWLGGGAWLMVLVWSVALFGTWLKLTNRLRCARWSTAMYVAFGWLVAGAGHPYLASVPPVGIDMLVAGGIVYTVGSAFYLLGPRMPGAHFVWHLFVLTGSVLHVLGVMEVVRA